MTFSVNSFVAAIDKSGARSNLFEVDISTPTAVTGDSQTLSTMTGLNTASTEGSQWRFLVNATTLPGYTNGEIAVPYFGRNAYFAGDTTFGDWTVTVLNDESMKIRKGVEIWMEAINSTVSNARSVGIQHSNITGSARIKTFGMGGDSATDATLASSKKTHGVTQVNIFDCWPSNISPIDLSQDAANTIETFQVTWQYNYIEHSNN